MKFVNQTAKALRMTTYLKECLPYLRDPLNDHSYIVDTRKREQVHSLLIYDSQDKSVITWYLLLVVIVCIAHLPTKDR